MSQVSRAAACALAALATGLVVPLTAATPAAATPPGPDGDLVFAGLDAAPVHGIYTLNPDDAALTFATVEEGNAVESPRGGIGPSFSPAGLLAMSLPDASSGGKPRIFTGTRTYKTDNTQLKRVATTHTADYDPAWSPDGSRLAFTGVVSNAAGASLIAYQHAGDIWTMNPNGTGNVQLTHSGEPADSPTWKPDGTALALTETSGGIVQLAEMNPDGSGLHLLKDGQAALDPAWSPDGTKIAFDSATLPGDTTSHSQIGVLDVATGTVTQLTTDTGRDLYFPTWSPNGATIAFEAYDSGADVGTIRTVPAAGGTPVDVTVGHHPTYSPDGTKFAFTKKSGNGSFDLFTVPVAGGSTTQVTTSPNDEWAPKWSHDGTNLVYISDENGNGEVWSKPATGGSATQLSTTTSGFDGAPDWSGPVTTQSSYVFVVNADGTNVQVVTLAIDGGNPAWSPDGQWIAFTDQGHVWKIHPTGTGLAAITTAATGTTDADPSWSPDGMLLAFSGAAANGDKAIWTISPDGLGLAKLAGGPGDHDFAPVWSPTGSRVAFLNGDTISTVPVAGGNVQLVKATGVDLTPQSLDWGTVGAPDTVIDTGPNGTFGGHDATFTYSTSRAPSTFECKLEASGNGGQDWTACGSGTQGTKTYPGLDAATYTFYVRATNGTGTDASPASSQFTVAPPGVTVTLEGSGAGTVTSSPAGIKCSPTSSQCIAVINGQVTLTAKADGLSTFTGWSGDCTGTGQCVVQAVNNSKHVTATFDVSGNGPPACTGTASTKTVNNWSASGCFAAAGSTFTTDQLVELNGLKVYPTDTTLTLNPATGMLTSPVGGHVSVLAGPTTISGTKVGPITLSVGALSLNLKATSVTLSVPSSAKLLGLPLTGSVTLTTPAAGTVDAQAHITLPAVLGGGSASAHLVSDAATGLHVDSLTVGPVDATLAALLRVKGATFSYTAGTGWSASGTVLVPGGSGTFAAKFVYAADVLQKADIVVKKVSIAGFLDASSFQIHYLTGDWSASAVVNGSNSMSGSLTFSGGVLSTMHLAATHLSAFGVIGVDNFDFAYDSASGWSVDGKVTGSAISGSVSGSATYTNGVLTAAHLGVLSLNVGKLFQLSSLNVDYDSDGTRDHWHGSATLGGPGGQTVTGDFALVGGALSTASLTVGHVDLFGVLGVDNFAFGYNGGTSTLCASSPTRWVLSGNVTVPGSPTFTLDAAVGLDAGGALGCGHLHVAKAKLAGVVDVNDFLVDFAGSGTWHGNADVAFPGGFAAAANVTFVNGALTALGGSLTVPGPGIPLGPSGVFVKGGSFQLDTLPQWQITGGLDITGGPTVPVINVAAIGINGSLQLRFPSAGHAPGLRVSGNAQLAGLPLAEAYVDYTFPDNVDVKGCLGTCLNGLSLAGGLAKITASVEGKVHGTKAFQVNGDAAASLHFKGCVVWCIDKTVGISGSVVASNLGLAACGHIQGMNDDWSAGIGYKWGSTPTAFSGCSLGAYESISSASSPSTFAGVRQLGDGRTRATAAPSIAVADGLPVEAFRFTGDTAPPFVTLHGPNGETIDANNANAGVAGGHVIMLDPAANETLVLVDHPSGGAWTVSVDSDSSSPLASSTEAGGLTDPTVSATVTGSGTARTLTWSLSPQAGQSVRFVENGPDSSKILGTVTAASGTVDFSPAPGPAGTRTIVAEVTQDGVPRASLDVATYSAPGRTVLTVSKDGNGVGTVTSSPAGISCGAACSADITPGATVQLSATPSAGMRFTGWGGACAGSSATCAIAPTESAAVVATFDKIPAPTVSALSPAAAKPGAAVTLTGTHLTGATKVTFGSVQAKTFTVTSPTSITTVVPVGALTGKVSVLTPGGKATSTKALKVIPVIASFSPSSAAHGAKVTIKGSALRPPVRVTVGGVAAKVVSSSWSKVVITVPKTAKSGKIVVTTAGGKATSAKSLRVTKP
jgi:Tol biopolymer transport system component